MPDELDWRRVYDFWFPRDITDADLAEHWRRMEWWMRGGASAELGPFAPVLERARAGQLDRWSETPKGRLSLILVLDQFPRGLNAGTPEAYAADPVALDLAERGLANGHYEALRDPYERFFFCLPLAHAEGPDHRERMRFLVAESERMLEEAPLRLKPIWAFSLSQARANLEVITRFGRFPHRNPILGRVSTAEEAAYIAKGDFVHKRSPPKDAA
jgi:uncharacterized protein (DUF924 family)